jgi:hypothetical protein
MSKKPKDDQPQAELDAYSIEGFCKRHSISRSTYYSLEAEGSGPVEGHAMGRILITKESAFDWRKKISE